MVQTLRQLLGLSISSQHARGFGLAHGVSYYRFSSSSSLMMLFNHFQNPGRFASAVNLSAGNHGQKLILILTHQRNAFHSSYRLRQPGPRKNDTAQLC